MKVMLAWYSTANLEQAKQFYGEVLGLEKVFEMQGWAEFSHRQGDAAIGLNAGGAPPAGATVVLGVDDLSDSMKRLRASGVEFVGDIMEIPGVVKIATFRDPFGNQLQLAQSLLQN